MDKMDIIKQIREKKKRIVPVFLFWELWHKKQSDLLK